MTSGSICSLRRNTPGGTAPLHLTFAGHKDFCVSNQKTALGPLGKKQGDCLSRPPHAELGFQSQLMTDTLRRRQRSGPSTVHCLVRMGPPGTVGLSSLPVFSPVGCRGCCPPTVCPVPSNNAEPKGCRKKQDCPGPVATLDSTGWAAAIPAIFPCRTVPEMPLSLPCTGL